MKILKITVIFALFAALIIGLYYYLSNIRETSNSNNEVRATKVQEIINRNIEIRYPPTPRELVRFFADITQCLYNENYSEQDFIALGEQLYRLYHDELKEINPWDLYLDDLRSDVNSHREEGFTVSSYHTSSTTDIEYSVLDGYEYANLHCMFNLRRGTDLFSIDHQFLLRKDENGRWKILGWQKVDI